MKIRKVVITGPESTGKTLLASTLASRYGTVWIPEYAREYICNLGRTYNYRDIEHIALQQVVSEKHYFSFARNFLFYDTFLVVTKIWFMILYDRYPRWIDIALQESQIDLFLVCNTDIPWIADPVRENGGEMRERLLDMYIKEINSLGIPWDLVTGKDEKRILSATGSLDKHFKVQQLGI